MWKNIVERGRPQKPIWRMRIACWITKATHTHTGFVILTAFPLQLWLQERALMLRYTYEYIACISRFWYWITGHTYMLLDGVYFFAWSLKMLTHSGILKQKAVVLVPNALQNVCIHL